MSCKVWIKSKDTNIHEHYIEHLIYIFIRNSVIKLVNNNRVASIMTINVWLLARWRVDGVELRWRGRSERWGQKWRSEDDEGVTSNGWWREVFTRLKNKRYHIKKIKKNHPILFSKVNKKTKNVISREDLYYSN